MAKRRKLKVRSKQKSDSLGRFFPAFIEYLKNECHLAPNTVAAYSRDTRRFQRWLDGRDVRLGSVGSARPFTSVPLPPQLDGSRAGTEPWW